MPRQGRNKSETGIYHVILRGINRQAIFEDDEDREKFIRILKRYRKISNFIIYAYCLMDNHVHLLIKETTESISLGIMRVCSSYVYWYNLKYERCGHLFQERFKSEAVDDDSYFLTLLRYIHQNPLKAGITKNVSDYRWSSYHEYINESVLIDTDFAVGIFSSDRQEAIKSFVEFINQPNEDQCLDYDQRIRVTDDEVRTAISRYGIENKNQLLGLNKHKREEIIKELKLINGVTVRQLSRITGISKSSIDRL